MIGYCDPFSGISGDMFLGALFAAGLSEESLNEQLAKINLSGYSLKVEDIQIKGLKSKKVKVTVFDRQPQRNWLEIKALIEESDLADNIKNTALSIFSVLAEAEAEVHGCTPEEVHFHEVGAVDSIIDIAGAAAGLNLLGITRVCSGPLPLASGWINCAHGPLPLPAPAVCYLVKGIPVYGVNDCQEELVTPTGAAIIKALSENFGPIPQMRVAATGYGAGSRKRKDGRPNLFRLIVGEEYPDAKEAGEVEVIETHLDDWQPESFPWLSERLFQSGALDVALVPIHMKKGRPGYLLRIISEQADSWQLKKIVVEETSTIGLRYRQENRWTLPRKKGYIDSRWGPLGVKKVETPQGSRLYPEYEACYSVARREGLSLREVYSEVTTTSPDKFKLYESS